MKYIDEPGNVTHYTPALSQGAQTDDDTDFEWVHLLEMQRRNVTALSPEQIVELWKARINRQIWCSNQSARQLLDLDLIPPLTGSLALNPWADFNISGQFLCESFGDGGRQPKSRAAYLAICLDMSDDLQRDHAVQWRAAINALAEFENVVQANFFYADMPAGEALRRRALKAGLRRPAEQKALW